MLLKGEGMGGFGVWKLHLEVMPELKYRNRASTLLCPTVNKHSLKPLHCFSPHLPTSPPKPQQDIAALSMHINCTAAAKAPTTGKPSAGKGTAAAPSGAPPPPIKATAAAAAAPAAQAGGGPRKGGKAGAAGPGAAAGAAAAAAQAAVQVTQAEEDSALASLQWVMSSRPDATVAGQQLKDAWARVGGVGGT